MVRKRLTREESQAQTRQRLLEAARIVFARRGYGGASVEEIAAEAGYSKGAVYSNFESKEDILLELKIAYAQAEFANFDQLVTKLAATNAKFEEAERAIRKWLDNFMADTELLVLGIELQLHARRNPAFAARYGALNDKHRTVLGQSIRRLFEALGKVPPKNCDEVAAALISMSLGLALENTTSASAAQIITTVMSQLITASPDVRKR